MWSVIHVIHMMWYNMNDSKIKFTGIQGRKLDAENKWVGVRIEIVYGVWKNSSWYQIRYTDSGVCIWRREEKWREDIMTTLFMRYIWESEVSFFKKKTFFYFVLCFWGFWSFWSFLSCWMAPLLRRVYFIVFNAVALEIWRTDGFIPDDE